jgi:hypothetical protein
MFENLEHGTIKRRPDEDASFGLDADDIGNETAKPLPRLGVPSVNNLAVSRPAPRKLERDDERRLIIAAQAGDDRAMRKLIDHHIAWIRYRARLRWYRSAQTIRSAPSRTMISSASLSPSSRNAS